MIGRGRPEALRARRWAWRDERGSATIEFVILAPVFIGFFLMAAEAGIFLTRQLMLERAVDIVGREIRLASGRGVDPEDLKERLCESALILPACDDGLTVEITAVDRSTYAMPDRSEICRDRGAATPTRTSDGEQSVNAIRVMRVCYAFEPVLPALGLGLDLVRVGDGTAQITTASAYVLEP